MNFLHTDLMKMLILYFSFVISNIKVAADKIKYDISWNPEVTEKLADGNVFRHDVTIGEYMDVICPQYDVEETNIMTFVIYNVTRNVFESCSKINEGSDKLLDCDRPTKNKKLTIKFQKFSPNPKGFIFYPGETYYLMAYPNDLEAEESQPNCNNKMRMEIRIHPGRHHKHVKKTSRTSTTTHVKMSPKFEMTKPIEVETSTKSTTGKLSVNHAGVFNDLPESKDQESNSNTAQSNFLLIVTSLIAFTLSVFVKT